MPEELRETLKRGFSERVLWWVTQVSDSSGVVLATIHERPKSTFCYTRNQWDIASLASPHDR